MAIKYGPGRKFDSEKLRYDLMPSVALEQIVDILTYGVSKYSSNNWQNVEPKDRYYAACLRHLAEYKKYLEGDREDFIDGESGKSHLAHAACNLVFLIWKEAHDGLVQKTGGVLPDDKEKSERNIG